MSQGMTTLGTCQNLHLYALGTYLFRIPKHDLGVSCNTQGYRCHIVIAFSYTVLRGLPWHSRLRQGQLPRCKHSGGGL